MKSLGNILGAGNVADLAASGQRESARESNRQRESNTINLWSHAVAHSRTIFGKRRLWRVVVVETITSEMIVGSRGAPADGEIANHPGKNRIAYTVPAAIKYFVRWRLTKGRKPEWVEVVFEHVDPLDFDSPKAWSLRPSKEQKEKR